ncbi:MAG TPA: hypothetical protein VHY91_10945 [Pirellulales bacterium]|nr:hypothetical protein [Pirellulales bacterium]
MNDNQRTVTYVVVAALAIVVAAEPWGRRNVLPTHVEETGKLFPDFKDPLAASSMTIVKYDEATGALHPFQVARVGGVWSIPSHQNYPADAKEQLAQAATTLMGLEILGVASNKPGDHELYGVLDPDPKTALPGSVGIGTRVTMKDAKDNVLADLIIGKADKDQPQLRYVRKAGRDQVYKVVVQTDKLSTKFGDWIEKDLLKLNPLDLVSVRLNDYSSEANPTAQGQVAVGIDLRSQIALDYDDTKNTWKLAKLVEFVDGKPKAEELTDDEELNVEKLNGMKTALDALQIVDVERKPAGMQGLKMSANFSRDQMSLFQRGFYLVGGRDEGYELLSSEGEAVVSTKDGTQYVLRFGQVTSGDSGTEDQGKAADGKKEPSSRLNRYLFVVAQFDPKLIPKPTLEPLPGEEADSAADEAKSEADDKAKATEETDAKKKSAADAKTGAKGDDKGDDKTEAKAGESAPDAKSIDQQAAEEEAAAQKKAEAEKRTVIEKSNKHKQEEYEEKLKKGEEHVKQLNERFGDWYYIISDEVYHKIHLGKTDVIKTKETKPGEGDLPADLKELEKAGLKKGPKP